MPKLCLHLFIASLTLSSTGYAYDSIGQLRMVTDPNGLKTYFLYDNAGRKVATIGADGNLTEIVYNQNNQVAKQIRYATALSAAQLTSLVDAGGKPTAVALASVRPAANGTLDQTSWNLYDSANRLVKTVDAQGYVVETRYDGASRVSDVIRYANPLAVTALATFAVSPTTTNATPVVNAAADRRVRSFYDGDGKLVGSLDGEGYLVEYKYNGAGLLSQTNRYATQTTSTLWATGTLATLRPTTNALDIKEYKLYDGFGLVRAEIDGKGFTTYYRYDNQERLIETYKGGRVDAATFLQPTTVYACLYATGVQAGGVWPQVQLRVDGVNVGVPVTIDATTLNYVMAVPNCILGTDHTIDLVFTNPGTAPDGTRSVTFGGWGSMLNQGWPNWPIPIIDLGTGAAAVDGINITQTGHYDVTLDQAGAYRQTISSYDGLDGYWYVDGFNPNTPLVDGWSLTPIRQYFNYDAYGRLILTSGQGSSTDISYDAVGNEVGRTQSSDNMPEVRAIVRRYDVQGHITAELDGVGAGMLTDLGTSPSQAQIDAIWSQRASTYTYDAAGRRISATDHLKNKTVYYYDTQGNLCFTINAMGEVTESRFNALGQRTDGIAYVNRLSSVAGLNGGPVDATLTSAVASLANAASDQHTHFFYTQRGQLDHSVDGTSGQTIYTYNAFGEANRLQTSLDVAGSYQDQSTAYDRRGLALSNTKTVSAGKVITTSQTYDAIGRIHTSVDGNQNTTTTDYAEGGRIVTVTDALGKAQYITYDGFGHEVSRTDANGNTSTTVYSNGNYTNFTITQTSALNNSTVTQLNDFGQVQSVTDALGNVTEYIYNADGQLAYTVDPTGAVAELQYDNAGHLIARISHANKTTPGVVLTQPQMRDVMVSLADSARDKVTTYAYDAAGRQNKIISAEGSVTELQYDGVGNVVAQKSYYNQVVALKSVITTNNVIVMNDGGVMSFALGDFAVGDVVTATLSYKCSPNAYIFFDVSAGSVNGGDQGMGDYDWKQLSTTFTVTSAGVGLMSLGTSNFVPGEVTLVDNIKVTCSTRGAILNETADNFSITRFIPPPNGTLNGYDIYSTIGWTSTSVVLPAAVAITQSAPITTAQITTALATLTADPINDRVTRSVYDAAGRKIYAMDAMGYVTAWKYDQAGEVLQTIHYDKQIATSTVSTKAAFDAALGIGTATPPTVARSTSYVYDATGRTAYTMDALGDVTKFVYDGDGHVLQQTQYATAIALTTALTTTAFDAAVASAPVVATAARNRTTSFVYDVDGRLAYQMDVLGGVSKNRYDASGRLIEQIKYATRIATTTALTTAAFDALMITNANATYDRPTRYVYDEQNQLRFTVDALGDVVEHIYDNAGRLARTIAYVDIGTPNIYTSVTDATKVTDLRSMMYGRTLNARETIYTYDADGRVVHTAQSVNVVGSAKYFTITENQYDSFGLVKLSTAYSTPLALQTLPEVVALADLSNLVALAKSPGTDRSTQYFYDAQGRVKQITDGEGYTELFDYDALGNKKTYTNKNGAQFTYTYDTDGRLATETGPAIDVAALDTALTTATTTNGVKLVTKMTYDALGNLLTRTEASGRPEQRTTSYQYDAVGHQTRTTYESVGVYSGIADNLSTNGVSGAAVTRTETSAIPANATFSQTAYNTFGEAVINRDVADNFSYKTYDKLGRLVNEVDGNKNVTQHIYSALDGQYSQLSRLATAATFTDGLTVSADTIDAAASTAQLSVYGSRNIFTYLDKLGRASSVTDLGSTVYSFDSVTGQGGFWTRQTSYTYDAWGDLTSKSSLLVGVPSGFSRLATTYYGYDLKGGLVRQVDSEGYVTDHSQNAFGEDIKSTQYATKIDVATSGMWANPVLSTPDSGVSGVVSEIGYDRTTVTTYDRRGMKLSEGLADVQVGQRPAANQLILLAPANVITTYVYDGVGNVIQTATSLQALSGTYTLQQGATSFNYYDAMGRLKASVSGTDTTASGAGRITTYLRDALGNALVTTHFANLSTGAGLAPAPDAVNDQTTIQVFDKLGRVIQSQDAEKNNHYYSFDAAGHVAKQWTPFKNADGIALNSIQLFAYDKAGRQTDTKTLIQRDATPTADYSTDSVVYNAYGEVVSKLRDTTQYAYFNYDDGGRVWRTNVDGVDKVYLYDFQDNVTALITNPTTNLYTGYASLIDTITVAGNVRTSSTYDTLKHLVAQKSPTVTHLDGTTTTKMLRQNVDAWGNVLEVTSTLGLNTTGTALANPSLPGNYTTSYRYNYNNQVIEEKLPTTTYYTDYTTRGDTNTANDVAGVATTARPTTAIYYDAWGHNIGKIDARGYTSTAAYLVTGELSLEEHADLGSVGHWYDNFGREITTCTASATSGFWSPPTTTTYDRLNHKLSTMVQGPMLWYLTPTGTSSTTNFVYMNFQTYGSMYTYDALGNRISETTGAAAKVSGVVLKYNFDTAGRLVKTTTQLGTAAPSKTLQTYYNNAGQKISEVDAIGQITSYSYLNGRLDKKSDIGGGTIAGGFVAGVSVTQYGYDLAGQLTNQTSTRGQNLSYTYYADGKLKSIRDQWNNSLSTYDYDVDGNKTRDTFIANAYTTNTGTVPNTTPTKYRDVTMTYDQLGRMATVTENASGTLANSDYALSIFYDANGNRYQVTGTYLDNDSEQVVSDNTFVPSSVTVTGLGRRKVDMLFSYDGMNRVTANRVLDYNGGTTEGYRWEYYGYNQDGLRTSEEHRTVSTVDTSAAGTVTGRLVQYRYDFAGRLSSTKVTTKTSDGKGGEIVGAARDHHMYIYGPSGSVQDWQWTLTNPYDSFSLPDLAPDRVIMNETTYNADGTTNTVTSNQKLLSAPATDPWSMQTNQTFTYDFNGTLQSSTYRDTSTNSLFSYSYTYLKMDSYLQRSTTVNGTQNGSALGSVTTTQDYDVNGHLVQTYDTNTATSAAEQFLVNDNTGHIVYKTLGMISGAAMAQHKATGTYDPNSTATPQGLTTGTAVAAAPVVPAFSLTTDGATSVQRFRYANDQVIGTTDASLSYSSQMGGDSGWTITTTTQRTDTRFDSGFSTSSASVGNSSATSYTWRTGDSLRSVAQTYYGDANLWYVIADANGLVDLTTPVVAGTVLSIPNVTRSSNTAYTYKAYDPSKIVSDTTPVPTPPPSSSGGGCGLLGTILAIAIAVAVTAFTAGALTVGLSGSLGSIMSAGVSVMTGAGAAVVGGGGILAGYGTAAAVIGGAVGSIASQGVAMATGMQQSFSWTNVALGAVGAGLGAAIGPAAVAFPNATPYIAAAEAAATGNAITQGIAVATGLQDHFDWRAVATSAIAAPIAQAISGNISEAIGKALDGQTGVFTRIALGIVNGVVSQTIRMNVYNNGKLDYASIASDAFGNALGESIKDTMMSQNSAQQSFRGSEIAYQNANAPADMGLGSGLGLGGGYGLASNASAAQAFSQSVDNGIADRVWRMQEADAYDRGDYVPGGGVVGAELPGMDVGGWQMTKTSGSYADLGQSAAETGMVSNTGRQTSGFANDVAGRKMTNDPLGLKAAWTSSRIDDFIAEAQANRGLPYTGNLDDSAKAELYHRMLSSSPGADQSLADLADGKKVIFGLRHETDIKANGGNGRFDDRVVIMSLDSDGKPQLHYEGQYNTEPSGRYLGKEGKNINYDKAPDLGRLPGDAMYTFGFAHSSTLDAKGGLRFGANIDGTPYNILKAGGPIYLERNANGQWVDTSTPGYGPPDNFKDNNDVYFHRGYTTMTGSAGCQTFPKNEFEMFFRALNPTGTQSQFKYYLKTM